MPPTACLRILVANEILWNGKRPRRCSLRACLSEDKQHFNVRTDARARLHRPRYDVEVNCRCCAYMINHLSWSIAAAMDPSALETCLSSLSIFSFSWPSLCFVEACAGTQSRVASAGSEKPNATGGRRISDGGPRNLTSKVLRKSVSWNSDNLIWSIVFL